MDLSTVTRWFARKANSAFPPGCSIRQTLFEELGSRGIHAYIVTKLFDCPKGKAITITKTSRCAGISHRMTVRLPYSRIMAHNVELE